MFPIEGILIVTLKTDGSSITIDVLLAHQRPARLLRPADRGWHPSKRVQRTKPWSPAAFTPEELVQVVADRSEQLRAGGGRTMELQQHRVCLLGTIIEQATGKSYEEENLKERIFEPLGLEQTYLQDRPAGAGRPAAGLCQVAL
ncbi:MAG: serine hydrolase [Caldilineales bacterium]